jgi:hypothetical protein
MLDAYTVYPDRNGSPDEFPENSTDLEKYNNISKSEEEKCKTDSLEMVEPAEAQEKSENLGNVSNCEEAIEHSFSPKKVENGINNEIGKEREIKLSKEGFQIGTKPSSGNKTRARQV